MEIVQRAAHEIDFGVARAKEFGKLQKMGVLSLPTTREQRRDMG